MKMEYEHLITPLEQVVQDLRDLPLALNDSGRLVFPKGERPSIVDLAFEAIRRGFRGKEATKLMRELAHRDWLFSLPSDDEWRDTFNWQDVPAAALEVVEIAGYPDLLEEWRAHVAEVDAELERWRKDNL